MLVALFDGAREFAPREMVAVGGCGSSFQVSSGGLCDTLKTLLMSSSYRVRSATARLVTSLCSDGRFCEEPAAADKSTTACGAGGGGAGGGGGKNRSGLFFREVLIAAGATGNLTRLPVRIVELFNLMKASGRLYAVSHVFTRVLCAPAGTFSSFVNRRRPRSRLSLSCTKFCCFHSNLSLPLVRVQDD